MLDPLERNKRNVMAFYDLMFNRCQPAEAIAKYAGDVYIQHNPAVADGKALEQSYRRLSGNQYRYRSAGGRFETDLEVDENGFVTRYPGFWEAAR